MLAFTISTGQVQAQKKIDSSASRYLTTIPFTLLSGGVIVINARLDNYIDTLNFIFDTGSGGISLDSSVVDIFKLPQTASERTLVGISSIRKVSYVMDRTLHLPKLDVEHLDFHINDYEILTSSYGIRIDGIIGHSFLKQFIVKVNYDRKVMEIWTPGTIKYPKGGFVLKPQINNIPVFSASVDDNRACTTNFYFDTGAGLSLLMSEKFKDDSSILRKGKKVILTQADGIGGKKAMMLTTVKEVNIGEYKFKKVPAHIFEDTYNVTSYPILGGLIGNDLLRRFNLVINYPKGEIHMRPNTHFKEQFDYSYTGLGIYMFNGDVVIEDVLKDSPGEQAGFKAGDIIVAIDNVFDGTIQNYKDLMQQVGARLKVLVMRDGHPYMGFLKVKSYLKETL